MSFEEAVAEQLNQFDVTGREVDLNYYKVIFNETAIGYFVTFPQCLYSFAIGMEWRKKEIKDAVFEKIKNELGDKFACILYKNNVRAIGWLKRFGLEEYSTDLEDNSTSLVYNKN